MVLSMQLQGVWGLLVVLKILFFSIEMSAPAETFMAFSPLRYGCDDKKCFNNFEYYN